MTLIQDDGGTASGGDDDAVLSVASTVTLTAVNDAPTLTATADDPTFTEGGAAAGSVQRDEHRPGGGGRFGGYVDLDGLGPQ